MTIGAYLVGTSALLLLVGSLSFAATGLRTTLTPGWSGARARLVEATIGVALLIVLAELLGIVGALSELPLLAGATALAAGSQVLVRRATPLAPDAQAPPWSPLDRRTLAVVAGICALVAVRWLVGMIQVLDEGIWAFDATWYHMPLAAGFAQTGSVTQIPLLDPVSLARYYPANSELVHGVGITVLHRDLLSPVLNLGWVALALLAAWSLGRPFKAAPLTLLAVAVLLVSHSFTSRQPGNAMSDVAAAALLLASAAVLANAYGPGSRWGRRPTAAALGPVVVAGLAAGLAAGTKLNVLAAVIALGVAIAIVAERGSRLRVGVAWGAAALATGGYWYARNLVATGNPLPWFKLGIGPLALPSTPTTDALRPGYTVVHYVTEFTVWREFFLPGLHISFGPAWAALIALAATGATLAAFRVSDPVRRALGACALVGMLAYLVTPLSAGGYEGSPLIFATNLRWVVVFLALGVALLATSVPVEATRARRMLAVALTVLFALSLAPIGALGDPHLPAALAAVLVAGALAAAFVVIARRHSGLALAAGAAGLAVLAALAYWPTASRYERDRYTDLRPGTHMTSSFSWAKRISDARIGLAGTTAAFFQYPFYGDDLSNAVRYIAHRGAHGSFTAIDDCASWRRAANRGRFTYIVTAPRLNSVDLFAPGFSPERGWAGRDSATRIIRRSGPVAVFKVDGRLHPGGCLDHRSAPTLRADRASAS